jgi:hypothetical protein
VPIAEIGVPPLNPADRLIVATDSRPRLASALLVVGVVASAAEVGLSILHRGSERPAAGADPAGGQGRPGIHRAHRRVEDPAGAAALREMTRSS